MFFNFSILLFLLSLNLNVFTNTKEEFNNRFTQNLNNCSWLPHPQHSVFTQWDKEFYLGRKEEFLHKYKSFYAVAQTISPKRIVELGTYAGSGADAYLSGSSSATEYIGFDVFPNFTRIDNSNIKEDSYRIAKTLLSLKGFKFKLFKTDLRSLSNIPEADLVIVDAAHDFENAYKDLVLSLTANPKFIFVDDMLVSTVQEAVDKFIIDYLKDKIDFTLTIKYFGNGLVIKLK